MKKQRLALSIILVSTVLNLFFGYRVWQDGLSADQTTQQEKLPLLSKRIFVDNPNDHIISFYPLRTKLRAMVAPWEKEFAFYFEYLPTGVSIGVNEKEELDASSLIKVPTAMAYFYQLENSGLSSVDPVVTLEKKHIDSGFGGLWQKGEGAKIRLSEALRLALVLSDNTASNVVASQVSADQFIRVYEGLDIDITRVESQHISIGAKSYASIFKALYLASIINREHSEKILEYLTQTPFNDKLVAGVPEGVKVSHKIGVYQGKAYQDCGIVYVPERPYMLCMMSISDEKDAVVRMRDLSRVIYTYVTSVD